MVISKYKDRTLASLIIGLSIYLLYISVNQFSHTNPLKLSSEENIDFDSKSILNDETILYSTIDVDELSNQNLMIFIVNNLSCSYCISEIYDYLTISKKYLYSNYMGVLIYVGKPTNSIKNVHRLSMLTLPLIIVDQEKLSNMQKNIIKSYLLLQSV